MFKPHRAACGNCNHIRIIVVKAGLCAVCNEAKKTKAKGGKKWVSIFDKKKKNELRRQLQGNNNRSDKGNFRGDGVSNKIQNTNPISQRDGKNDSSVLEKTKTLQRRFSGVKKNTPIRKNRKATGEKLVFLEIWEEREHVCSCCDKPLGDEPSPTFFSHLLAKSTYPSLRLAKRNIWLKCGTCHDEWGNGDRSQPKFAAAVAETQRLKLEYYTKTDR